MIVPVGKTEDGHIIYNTKFCEPHRDEIPKVSLHFLKGTGTLYWLDDNKSIRSFEVNPGDVIDDFDFQSIIHWFVSKDKSGVDFYRVLQDGSVEPQVYFHDFINRVTKDKT